MSEHKAVVWFGDDPQPNTFFFRSPFRSWKFLTNLVVLSGLFVGFAIVLFRNQSHWPFIFQFGWVTVFMVQGTVYPFLRLFQGHKKINELCRAGKITEEAAESPVDVLLSVADKALNHGVFYSSVILGIFLVFAFVIHPK